MEFTDHKVNSVPNVSRVVDPDLTWQMKNVTVHSTITKDSVSGGSGIVPALIAAALFISFLLALYAVLWKCMDSKVPQRKKSKLRVRVRHMDTA